MRSEGDVTQHTAPGGAYWGEKRPVLSATIHPDIKHTLVAM